jgi:membrane-associated phospholipid phosphatase
LKQRINRTQSPIHKAVHEEATPPQQRRRRTVLFLSLLLGLTAVFAVLAVFAGIDAFFPVDLTVTHFLQSLDYPVMTGIMTVVSWPGYMPQSAIVVALIVVLLTFMGFHWEAVTALAAAVFEELLNMLVKVAVHRPRPSADLVHVVKSISSYSFPSGHVMFYTVIFGFLFYLVFALLKPTRRRTLMLALSGLPVPLVGVARIYLGEHWFSDAIGAYLLGAIALTVVILFYRWGKNRFFLRQPAIRGQK